MSTATIESGDGRNVTPSQCIVTADACILTAKQRNIIDSQCSLIAARRSQSGDRVLECGSNATTANIAVS